MNESLDTIVFFVTAAIAVVASLVVVTRKNPVYSAIFMVLFFVMLAIDFLILRAPFLAVVQVLVYGGAIMVLFLFVIMLLNLKPEELREEVSFNRRTFALAVSSSLFMALAVAIRSSEKVRDAPSLTGALPESTAAGAVPLEEVGSVASISDELFGQHGLAFELTSVLILIAIIGAIFLTKKRKTVVEHAPEPR